MKYFHFFTYLWLIFVFSTCKKAVNEKDFISDSNIIKVLDQPGDLPFSYMKRPSGGYFLVFGEMKNRQSDVSVAVTDNFGNITHKTTFGGSRNESIWLSQLDGEGNLYICGLTYSPELRLDKNAALTNYSDGFLAKVDKDGNLLWQRGYSDTASMTKGAYDDYFREFYIIDNKIYCFGLTTGWHEPVGSGQIELDSWLVSFDLNGNYIKDRILQSLTHGIALSNYGGRINSDAIKLDNNDLIIRYNFMDYQSQGRYMDTTSMLYRYSIAKDSVVWANYYNRMSPQGDICWGGLLASGNLAYFDSYWNTIHIFDAQNGNLINTSTINNNTASSLSNQYFSNLAVTPFKTGDYLYFAGYNSKGGISANQKPFLAKLDKNGNVMLNKTFEIGNAAFYWVTLNENNNLQILGKVNYFNSDNLKLFTLSTDENGNLIK